jgi:hypothetical protein
MFAALEQSAIDSVAARLNWWQRNIAYRDWKRDVRRCVRLGLGCDPNATLEQFQFDLRQSYSGHCELDPVTFLMLLGLLLQVGELLWRWWQSRKKSHPATAQSDWLECRRQALETGL